MGTSIFEGETQCLYSPSCSGFYIVALYFHKRGDPRLSAVVLPFHGHLLRASSPGWRRELEWSIPWPFLGDGICFSGSGSHSLPVVTTEPENCLQLDLCLCRSAVLRYPITLLSAEPCVLVVWPGLVLSPHPHPPNPQRAGGQELCPRCLASPHSADPALSAAAWDTFWLVWKMNGDTWGLWLGASSEPIILFCFNWGKIYIP